ncbi:hypothetical protein F5887DRAFT_923288 [Amanita rubescens]|nr:hypothetical protein F5887DRAFT_923288 [Amanita rubescens]
MMQRHNYLPYFHQADYATHNCTCYCPASPAFNLFRMYLKTSAGWSINVDNRYLWMSGDRKNHQLEPDGIDTGPDRKGSEDADGLVNKCGSQDQHAGDRPSLHDASITVHVSIVDLCPT